MKKHTTFLCSKYILDEPTHTLVGDVELILISNPCYMGEDAKFLGFDVCAVEHDHSKDFMCRHTYQQSKLDDPNHMLELHYDIFNIPVEDLEEALYGNNKREK